MTAFETYVRLEPDAGRRDLDRGIAAEIADPLWFLTRQWQLGEHHGDDAGSPVTVRYRLGETPLALADGTEVDVVATPTEALVEAAPTSWWTAGRRITVGRAVAAAAAVRGVALPPDARLAGLPRPYDRFDGTGFDGQALYARRAELGLADELFDAVPSPLAAEDAWQPDRFEHATDRLRCGSARLSVSRHTGGSFGWYSVDADRRPAASHAPPVAVYPTRLRYPGAPNPRWWELERHTTDVGAYAPGRSHFATLLLIELVTTHADDWFTLPITVRAGHICALNSVKVTDAFGDIHTARAPSDWDLYAVPGLTGGHLATFPAALHDLTGPPLELVDVAVDEAANVAWAVERRIANGDVIANGTPRSPRVSDALDASAHSSYRYEPATALPRGWHPYVPSLVDGRTRFVQGRLARTLAGKDHGPPSTSLLRTPRPGAAVHDVLPAAIATRGVRLESRYRLARATDGSPVLWLQRSTAPRPDWVSAEQHYDLLALE